MKVAIHDIAKVAHEVNRAYCESLGDDSTPAWEDAPLWQRESIISGVTAILDGRVGSPEESHEAWMMAKAIDGWKYGKVKDAVKKTHPCMVAYAQLPVEQRAKDVLFHAVVRSLR